MRHIKQSKASNPDMYRKLYDNICLESVFVRYALIEFCYGNYSPNELLNKKLALKEDMNRLGVNRAAEIKLRLTL